MKVFFAKFLQTRMQDWTDFVLDYRQARPNQQSRSGPTAQQIHDDEYMFTRGAIACATSFLVFSLLATSSLVTAAMINRKKILIEKSNYARSLYSSLCLEIASILLCLNICVAFLTFTAQSKKFRIALLDERYRWILAFKATLC